tara:strand:+ start:2704 stop:3867 length:1164 start_codon:yes stop_codon:yes gene_type:complete
LNFIGILPASKSLYNRALVVQSYFSDLQISGSSNANDVLRMKECIQNLQKGGPFDCGEAGTVLRFMALRVSRESGRFVLTGSRRLFSRPQSDLLQIFKQLGVNCQISEQEMVIESEGWRPQGDTLLVPCESSSQFLSAVALNGWNLDFDLFVSPMKLNLSRAYFKMTQQFLMDLGMKFKQWDQDFCISKGQKISTHEVTIEPDMSSCFSMAAVAAVSGHATFKNFPEISLQPDYSFLDIFRVMGVPFQFVGGDLKVSKATGLKGVSVDLKDTPDLFPVLAALCSFAEGESLLYGAPHLKHKESSRILKTMELLRQVGCQVEQRSDGLKILPPKNGFREGFEFDPEDDHRLAMAAAVFIKGGVKLNLKHKEVVSKSFPEFWNFIGIEN